MGQCSTGLRVIMHFHGVEEFVDNPSSLSSFMSSICNQPPTRKLSVVAHNSDSDLFRFIELMRTRLRLCTCCTHCPGLQKMRMLYNYTANNA